MFLKNKKIIFKIKRSKVTDYAALTYGSFRKGANNKVKKVDFIYSHSGKCIRRFGGIYAYCRYFIDPKC